MLSLVAGVAVADGPESGVVSGKVTDVQGQLLPGVAVTIEGVRGTDATVTDDAGYYRFALLVPGSYSVKAMLEGFKEPTATPRFRPAARSRST